MKNKPPIFAPTAEPMDAADWLRDIKRLFDHMDCPEQDRVRLASHQLNGSAADWWETHIQSLNDPFGMSWAEFSIAFKGAYVSTAAVAIRRKEFQNLVQDKMAVQQYAERFTYLSRYATQDVQDPEDKISRFLDGLNPALKNHLVSHEFTSFNQVVSKAVTQEESRRQLNEDRKKNKPVGQSSGPHKHGQQQMQGKAQVPVAPTTNFKAKAPQ